MPKLPERSPPSSTRDRGSHSKRDRSRELVRRRSVSHRRDRTRSRSKKDKKDKKERSRSRRRSSKTPPRQKGEHREPATSSKRTSAPNLPAKFRPDDDFLDTTVVAGYQLPRTVASTTYSIETGIAGLPTTEIPLHTQLYGTLENWSLRYLASGQRGYLHLSRNYRESALLFALSLALKDKDCELLIAGIARSKNLAYNSTDEKKAATKIAADDLVQYMHSKGTSHVNDKLMQRIEALEAENARHVLDKPPTPTVNLPVQSARKEAPPIAVDDPFSDLRRPTNTEKYLQKSAPITVKAREINTWYNKLKMKQDQKNFIEALVVETNEAYEGFSASEKSPDEMRAIAVDWGLPFGLAGSMDLKLMFKVIATAVVITKKD